MKTAPSFHALASASLKNYLLELQESGIDGLQEESLAIAPITPVPNLPEPSVTKAVAAAPPGGAATALPRETLDSVRKQLGDCHRCKLGDKRTNLVFGVGNPKARLVFVGEGPGADEDRQGEPFVGEAGRILNRIIIAMGLQREDVYICNVVKCRPPGNRDPEHDEVEACAPFLLRQLQAIGPEVIVALGKFAAHTLLATKEPITKMRGRFRDYNGIPLMPTFHPSYLLHRQGEGNMQSFWEVWDDMTQVLRLLKLPVPEKNRKQS